MLSFVQFIWLDLQSMKMLFFKYTNVSKCNVIVKNFVKIDVRGIIRNYKLFITKMTMIIYIYFIQYFTDHKVAARCFFFFYLSMKTLVYKENVSSNVSSISTIYNKRNILIISFLCWMIIFSSKNLLISSNISKLVISI